MSHHFYFSLFILLTSCSFLGCEGLKKFLTVTEPPPSLNQYIQDTDLMLNICQKFQFETDIKTLHKVAVSVQQTRVISCANFNNECTLYGDYLNTVIDVTEDQILTAEERKKMELQFLELKASIKEGIMKLRELKKQ